MQLLGCSILYDYEFDRSDPDAWQQIQPAPNPWTTRLPWPGRDFFHHVVSVSIEKPAVNVGEPDIALREQIAALPELRFFAAPADRAPPNLLRAVCQADHIHQIDLYNGDCTDEQCDALRNTKSLRLLYLETNQVSDAAFQSLGTLDLTRLILKGPTTDQQLANFHLPNLESLMLLNANITTEGLLPLLEGTTRLNDLSVANCTGFDRACETLGHQPQLQYLALSRCDISDAGLSRLAGCKALQAIHLFGGNIEGRCFQNPSQWPNLASLEIKQPEISTEAIDAITRIPSLTHLLIPAENVTPEAIAAADWKCSSLTTLALHGATLDDAAVQRLAAFPTLRGVTFGEVAYSNQTAQQIAKQRPDLRLVPGY